MYPSRPYPARPPPNTYAANDSYHSSEQTLRPMDSNYSSSTVGRTDDPNQYSDTIPLKDGMQMSGAKQDWQDENTKYSPAAIEHQPPTSPVGASRKQKGFFKGKIPWVVYFLTLVQCSVFIGEIAKYGMFPYVSVDVEHLLIVPAILTGSPIEIHPTFNPMIGPSTELMINMGARYVPCMRTIAEIQNATETIEWPCPNTTTTSSTASSNQCTLSELCGLGGINLESPNQWFRFITPMFLHAGIIHIGMNMIMQMTMGREMEIQIGSIRFVLVYFSSGIFGFVLGGNFAAEGIATTGASGALFGIMGLYLLDLFYTWRERKNPVRDLMFSLLDIVIAFVVGLLPGVVDNFSHMGGLLMGLALGISILHSPNALRQRIGVSNAVYEPMDAPNPGGLEPGRFERPSSREGISAFAKKPVGFFKDRKPLWWGWWLLRAGALVGVFVAFIVLLNNFYKYRNTCSWCKYLSCLVCFLCSVSVYILLISI